MARRQPQRGESCFLAVDGTLAKRKRTCSPGTLNTFYEQILDTVLINTTFSLLNDRNGLR
jgi:hypothetical protein